LIQLSVIYQHWPQPWFFCPPIPIPFPFNIAIPCLYNSNFFNPEIFEIYFTNLVKLCLGNMSSWPWSRNDWSACLSYIVIVGGSNPLIYNCLHYRWMLVHWLQNTDVRTHHLVPLCWWTREMPKMSCDIKVSATLTEVFCGFPLLGKCRNLSMGHNPIDTFLHPSTQFYSYPCSWSTWRDVGHLWCTGLESSLATFRPCL
jgi:hypothetical protein